MSSTSAFLTIIMINISWCPVTHTSNHNTLYLGGDGLLHVGVCCKLLVCPVYLKGSKQMAIIESHTANQTCHWQQLGGYGQHPLPLH
jgi:hypothetical protein